MIKNYFHRYSAFDIRDKFRRYYCRRATKSPALTYGWC